MKERPRGASLRARPYQRQHLRAIDFALPALLLERLADRTPEAGALYEALRARNVMTDHRGDVPRFGFGVFQGDKDAERLVEVLAGLK